MLEQTSNSISFYFHFVSSGGSATGLTPTVSVWSSTGGSIVTDSTAATETLNGVFQYVLSSSAMTTARANYLAVGHTTSTGVTQQDIPALWVVGQTWVQNINDDILGKLETTAYTAPPSVTAIRTEMDTNSTKLDVSVGTRLASSGYTAPPSVTAIRQEMDTNSTDLNDIIGYVDSLETRLTSARAALMDNLSNLDASVASRLASSGYTAPDNTGIAAIQAKTTQLNFTGTDVKATLDGETVVVTTGTYDSIFTSSGYTAPSTTVNITTGTYDSISSGVWSAQSSAYDTTGTMGNLLNDAGAAADPLLNTVPGSYASGSAGHALGRIGSGQISVVNMVAQSGDISIVKGDDYYNADGRALDWTETDGTWPTLTTASVKFYYNSTSWNMTVVTATGSSKKVRLELASSDTNTFTAGRKEFYVQATHSTSPHTATLVQGSVTVQEP